MRELRLVATAFENALNFWFNLIAAIRQYRGSLPGRLNRGSDRVEVPARVSCKGTGRLHLL